MIGKEKNRVRTKEETQILMGFGEKLRETRKSRGHSQEELAHIAGFSRSYYTEVESGRRNVSLLNLYKLADALNCDPQELLASSPMKGQRE